MQNLQEIDRMILRLQEQGYNTVTKLAVKAFNYASNMIMQTAIRVSCTIFCNIYFILQRQYYYQVKNGNAPIN